jgi:hypothetical protein
VPRNTSSGQATVEYLLMTLVLMVFFIGMYRLLHQQLRDKSFTRAGKAILTVYY